MVFALALVWASSVAYAQSPAFRVEIPFDTVGVEEVFPVHFIVENAEVAQFQLPFLDHFVQHGGPQVSTSLSIINGRRTQSSTYTYYLRAPKTGTHALRSLQISTSAGYLESKEITIVVQKEAPQRRQKAPAMGGNPWQSLGGGGMGFGFPDMPPMPQLDMRMPDMEQFFNNPNFFRFEMPSFPNMPNSPDFGGLFKQFDQLFEQQYAPQLRSPRGKETPKIDPKTNQPVYKI